MSVFYRNVFTQRRKRKNELQVFLLVKFSLKRKVASNRSYGQQECVGMCLKGRHSLYVTDSFMENGREKSQGFPRLFLALSLFCSFKLRHKGRIQNRKPSVKRKVTPTTHEIRSRAEYHLFDWKA
jgi:hypothetical protein